MRRTTLTFIAVTTLALLATGCATGNNGGTRYQEMANTLGKTKPGQGRIYYFRADTAFGAALQPAIRLNKQTVGTSKRGSFFFVDRPAGDYVTSTMVDSRTTGFTLTEGQTVYVRMSPSFGLVVGSIVLDVETPEKAQAEMRQLAYWGMPVLDK